MTYLWKIKCTKAALVSVETVIHNSEVLDLRQACCRSSEGFKSGLCEGWAKLWILASFRPLLVQIISLLEHSTPPNVQLSGSCLQLFTGECRHHLLQPSIYFLWEEQFQGSDWTSENVWEHIRTRGHLSVDPSPAAEAVQIINTASCLMKTTVASVPHMWCLPHLLWRMSTIPRGPHC